MYLLLNPCGLDLCWEVEGVWEENDLPYGAPGLSGETDRTPAT